MAAGEIVVSLVAATGSFVTEMDRAAKEAERLSRSVERQIKILEQQALYAGKSADQIALLKLSQKSATEEQLGRAQTAIDSRVAAENAAAVQKTVAALQQEAEWAGKAAAELKVLELASRGATQEQQDAAAAALQIRRTLEDQAAAAASVKATVAALADQATQAGKTAEQVTLLNLAGKGATEEQLSQAKAFIATADAMRKQAAAADFVKQTLASLRERAEFAGKSPDDVTLIKLQRAGATPRELGEARSSINARMAAENAAAVKQEISALEQLAQQAGKTAEEITLLNLAGKGATEQQLSQAKAFLATADAMRKQAAAADFVTETLASLRKSAESVGKSTDEKTLLKLQQSGATPRQLGEARSSINARTAAENAAAVKQEISALEQLARQAGKTAEEIRLLELAGKGANDSQLAAAKSYLATAEALREEAAAAAQVKQTLQALQDRVAFAGKSQDETSLLKLQQQGASQQDLGKASQLINRAAVTEDIAALEKEVTALRAVAAQSGKSAAEIKLLEQANRGATAAELDHVKALLDQKSALELAAKWEISLENIRASARQRQREAYEAQVAEAAAIDAEVAALQKLASQVGKSADELKVLELAERGATQAQADAAAAALVDARAKEQQISVLQRLADLRRAAATAGKTSDEAALHDLAHSGATPAQLQTAQTDITARREIENQAAIQQTIRSLKEKATQAGMTAEQIQLLNLTEKGATQIQLDEAAAAIQLAAARHQQAAEATQSNAFLAGLKQEVDAIGKTRSELVEMKAAQLGVTTQAAPFIAALKNQEKGLRTFGENAALTRQQMIFAGVQLKDFFESVISGQSPMRAFLQQGATTVSVFGGFKNTFEALKSVFTASRVAIGGVGTVIGAFAVAAYQGHEEAKELARSLMLTGNAAGITQSSFDELTQRIASAGHRSIGNVREFGRELAKTGQIWPLAFESATAAAEHFSEVTGQTAEETAKTFATWAGDPTAAAKELTKTYGLLSLSQYESVRAFQEQGRSGEAFKIVTDSLNDRLQNFDKHLGSIDRLWRMIKESASGAWAAMKGIGAPETTAERLKQVEERLEKLTNEKKSAPPPPPPLEAAPPGLDAERYRAMQEALREPSAWARSGKKQEQKDLEDRPILQSRLFSEEIGAALEAFNTQRAKDALAASDFVLNVRKRIFAVEELQKALDEANRHIDIYNQTANQQGLSPVSEEQRDRFLLGIMKERTDPRIAATAQANVTTVQAQTDSAMKAVEQTMMRAKNDLAFHNSGLQALYQQGALSLTTYYAERREIIRRGAEEEATVLEAQALGQRRVLQQSMAALTIQAPIMEPAEIQTREADLLRQQTQINDLTVRAAEARRRAAQESALTLLEQAAAAKQLTQDMREFQASILQLQGRDLEAAGLRTQNVISRQQDLLRKGSPPTTGDEVRLREHEIDRAGALLGMQDKLTEAQRQQGLITERQGAAEDRLQIDAQRAGLSQIQIDARLSAIRGEGVIQLQRQVDAAQAAVDAMQAVGGALTPDSPAVLALERLRLQLEKAKDAADPLRKRLEGAAEDIGKGFAGSVENALMDGDWSKVGSEIGKTLQRALMHELVTQPLQDAVTSLLKGSIPTGADGKTTAANSGEGLIKTLFTAGNKLGSGVWDLIGGRRGGAEQAKFQTAQETFRSDELGKNDAVTQATGGVTDSLRSMGSGVDAATKSIMDMSGQTSLVSNVLGLLPQTAAGPATTGLFQVSIAAQAAAQSLQLLGASSGAGGGTGIFGSLGAESPGLVEDAMSLMGFAGGGRPPTDRPSIVGELGPELFHPDGVPGTIVPLSASASWPRPVAGSAQQPMTLRVINNGPPMRARQETGPGGNPRVVLDLVKDDLKADMHSGGTFASAMESTMGTRRAPQLFR